MSAEACVADSSMIKGLQLTLGLLSPLVANIAISVNTVCWCLNVDLYQISVYLVAVRCHCFNLLFELMRSTIGRITVDNAPSFGPCGEVPRIYNLQ